MFGLNNPQFPILTIFVVVIIAAYNFHTIDVALKYEPPSVNIMDYWCYYNNPVYYEKKRNNQPKGEWSKIGWQEGERFTSQWDFQQCCPIRPSNPHSFSH